MTGDAAQDNGEAKPAVASLLREKKPELVQDQAQLADTWGQVAQCTRESAASITKPEYLCIVRPDPVHVEQRRDTIPVERDLPAGFPGAGSPANLSGLNYPIYCIWPRNVRYTSILKISPLFQAALQMKHSRNCF